MSEELKILWIINGILVLGWIGQALYSKYLDRQIANTRERIDKIGRELYTTTPRTKTPETHPDEFGEDGYPIEEMGI